MAAIFERSHLLPIILGSDVSFRSNTVSCIYILYIHIYIYKLEMNIPSKKGAINGS